MTSGHFATYPVDSITINRDERQRKELRNIEELAASISRSGLIHPPVITRDGVLVAGERRLTAIKSLGWDNVPVQFAEDLDPLELHLIELEENTRRVDIDWKDQCLAVERYHQLRLEQDETWTAEKTADALGIAKSDVTAKRDVAREITRGNESVTKADKYSVARGLVQRAKARAKNTTLKTISVDEPEAAPKPTTPLINEDFIEWSASYSGPKFNFLHCDFPYGVNVGGHGQAADQAFGNYNDDPDTYWKLLDAFINNSPNFIADSSHCMFWFAMRWYGETKELLSSAGWDVNPYPLVWFKSDNSGILPDSNRGPRRNYETAFLCTRGDRFIVRAVSNVCSHPNTKSIHMSEKPIGMLEHFFRMFVDESSFVLDPTCGSGNALKVAERMGAAQALGIERNEEFYKSAMEAWESS